jgi:hypothetical protein
MPWGLVKREGAPRGCSVQRLQRAEAAWWSDGKVEDEEELVEAQGLGQGLGRRCYRAGKP